MNKLGILTGVLLMIFGIIEQTTLIFSIGMSLMFISLLGELFRTKLFYRIAGLSTRLQVRELENYRLQNQQILQDAGEWLDRFASRFHSLINSTYAINPDGTIRLHKVESERADGETLFNEFKDFLVRKGIQIKDECLRMEINQRVLQKRMEQFRIVLSTIIDKKPTLGELLQIFVEEEKRVESTSSHHQFWNRSLLLIYIGAEYTDTEIRQLFPRGYRNLKQEIDTYLRQLEQEHAIRWRLGQLEEWLVGVEDEFVVTIQHFDRSVHQYTDFRMGIVYLLEKIGYRVSLPDNPEDGVDLLVERSGVRHGVILKPLEDNQSITTHSIHESHTARTLAKLQSLMLITNRSYTPPALTLASKLGLICIDREKLIEWLTQYTNPYQQTS